MTVIPPVTGHNVGAAAGGGFLDSIKNAISGAGGTGAAGGTAGATTSGAAGGPTATKGDGSVGLLDGVLMKAGMGGAAGALAGWIMPFGGPIIGGIVGALGGAVLGVFGNMKKMNDIKQQNQAILDQMGVGTQDPAIQQILQSGNVQQLVPMAQQEMAGYAQQGGVPQQAGQYPTTQVGGGNVDQNPFPAQVGLTSQVPTTQVDPSATPGQSPVPTQAPIGTSSPATDVGVSQGDVGGVPTTVTTPSQDPSQGFPPVPTAIQGDPSIAQNAGAGSIMNVAQASATLGAPSGVPAPDGLPQQTSAQVPYGYGIGIGGGATAAAQYELQISQLQAQIDQIKAQLAQLPSDGGQVPTTQTAPTTQAA